MLGSARCVDASDSCHTAAAMPEGMERYFPFFLDTRQPFEGQNVIQTGSSIQHGNFALDSMRPATYRSTEGFLPYSVLQKSQGYAMSK